jgi:hypothetical protein
VVVVAAAAAAVGEVHNNAMVLLWRLGAEKLRVRLCLALSRH